MINVIKNYTDLTYFQKEINELVKNFKPTQLKGIIRNGKDVYFNEYNKEFLNTSSTLIFKIEQIIKEYYPKHFVVFRIARLNKIDLNSNVDDDFHDDLGTGNLIFLHYPVDNSHFVGGEFEWENNEIITIENGMNLILVNNPRHRVLNVSEGERYSFAFFFDIYEKKNNLI